MSQDFYEVRSWALRACANLPDSQGLVPFKEISPEYSKTGWFRQAQSNLMDDLTVENWGKKEMIHARYQPNKAERVWYLSFIYQIGSVWMNNCSVWGQILAESLGRRKVRPLTFLHSIQNLGGGSIIWQSLMVHFCLIWHTPFRTCLLPARCESTTSLHGLSSYPFLLPDVSVSGPPPSPPFLLMLVRSSHW